MRAVASGGRCDEFERRKTNDDDDDDDAKGKKCTHPLGEKRSVFWVDKKKQKTCFLRIKSLIIVHVAAVTKRPVTKASEFG